MMRKKNKVIDRTQHAYTIHDALNRAFTVHLPQKKFTPPDHLKLGSPDNNTPQILGISDVANAGKLYDALYSESNYGNDIGNDNGNSNSNGNINSSSNDGRLHDEVSSFLTKTTIVSFAEKDHAFKLASLLEAHKAANQEWPTTVFDDGFKLQILTLNSVPLLTGELSIVKWDLSDLRMYCIDNIIDMMYIKDMEDTGKSLRITSDLVRLDMTKDFYIAKFTEMLQRD